MRPGFLERLWSKTWFLPLLLFCNLYIAIEPVLIYLHTRGLIDLSVFITIIERHEKILGTIYDTTSPIIAPIIYGFLTKCRLRDSKFTFMRNVTFGWAFIANGLVAHRDCVPDDQKRILRFMKGTNGCSEPVLIIVSMLAVNLVFLDGWRWDVGVIDWLSGGHSEDDKLGAKPETLGEKENSRGKDLVGDMEKQSSLQDGI
ncbi:hypothetical protein L207DRAFT_636150 [Hyaloscypha variabilis F]|uniref:Uncharacterized protein n=1 Tax=Hyaloscypha variabilis (strain UAMH 11265 / GT02V1 / F) TaxID=1149755 RepID=A0A2J6RG09_HYAVF|nr:hypothetical protein L207DRAFT_636150 [Hyaloscypha variabilis F]